MIPVVEMGKIDKWEEVLRRPSDFIPTGPDVGGLRCFAVRPEEGHIDLITRYKGTYVVIDPDQTVLEHDSLYLIRQANGGHLFKRFLTDPPRLEPIGTRETLKSVPIGAEAFTVVGRVTHAGIDL